MKLNLRLAAACAVVALAVTPASAQLLGGNLGGGLGGTLNGTLGGAGRSVGGAADGTLRGTAATRAERNVDTRSGRASGLAGASGGLAGSLDAVTSSSLASGRGSASGNASASKEASFGVDGVGTDDLAGTVGGVVGVAGRATQAIGTPSLAGGGNATGSGQGSTTFGPLAAAGSLAANAAGALTVEPGMIVRDTAGRAIGEVQQVKATARGVVDSVIVEVGDRLAALPADNFSVSGDALVSAMSRAEVRREAREQQAAE